MAVGGTVVHFTAVKSVIHSFAPLEFPSLLVDPHSSFATTRLCTLSSVPSSILISFHYPLEYFNLFFSPLRNFFQRMKDAAKKHRFFSSDISNCVIF